MRVFFFSSSLFWNKSLFGNPEGLSIVEMERKYKLAQYVPYWQTSEAQVSF